VALADRGDDADVRPRNGRQGGDLTGLVGAHFQNHDLGIVRRIEERERHADAVVQIPACGVDRPAALHGGTGQVLGGRLPRGAGDADNRSSESLSAVPGQRAEGHQGVFHRVQPRGPVTLQGP